MVEYGINDNDYVYKTPEGVEGEFSAVDRLRERLERSGLCKNLTALPETKQIVREVCADIRVDERSIYGRFPNINPFRHRFLIDGAGICSEQTTMVVLVHSLHNHTGRRAAIRDTWGGAIQTDGEWPRAKIQLEIKVVYVFGTHVNSTENYLVAKEANKFKDVITGDFIESYSNMTLKSLLGLKWVVQHCSHVKYLVKSDDDMIINFPYLLNVIKEHDLTRSILGPLNTDAPAARVGKWNIARSTFPLLYYPPYESGSCYVISADIIKELYHASFDVQRIFIDDVYITGILGKVIGVRHVNKKGFAYWATPPPTVCEIMLNKVITGTRMTPVTLRQLWTDLHDRGKC